MADTKIRRITKKDEDKSTKKSNKASKKSVKKDIKKVVKPKSVKVKKQKKERKAPKWLLVISTPFRAIGRYIANAVRELKQTHWPNRKTTWKLTLAVLIFGGFFIVLILLVDYGFEQLLQMILSI